MARRSGQDINAKRVQRVRRQSGLQVHKRQRKLRREQLSFVPDAIAIKREAEVVLQGLLFLACGNRLRLVDDLPVVATHGVPHGVHHDGVAQIERRQQQIVRGLIDDVLRDYQPQAELDEPAPEPQQREENVA